MTDLDQILPLWRDLRDSRTEYVLATVVKVEGSGYRKAGARMIVTTDGRRAGTVSGGCLEAEVARKAFWHTEDGPVVRGYSTGAEDGDVPYGMGCGGTVHLLLERSETANLVMERLAACFDGRKPLAITTVVEGEHIGMRAYWPAKTGEPMPEVDAGMGVALVGLARAGFDERRPFTHTFALAEGRSVKVQVEYAAARPGLFVFGAGDDAAPLVRLARQLGWYVTLADGRSHLATRARFPEAHEVLVLPAGEFPKLRLRHTDAVAILTHSLEQDTRILRELLSKDLAYLGVLGPRHRTDEILLGLAREFGVPEPRIDAQLESWMQRIHAPMGLDLGGGTPADIALAVVSEIQQSLHAASGKSLREVRGRSTKQRRLTA